jgi:hypothetical protein
LVIGFLGFKSVSNSQRHPQKGQIFVCENPNGFEHFGQQSLITINLYE